MKNAIPKRLIQTGKSRELPLMAQAAVANLKLLNPDYEYLYFDDAQVESFIDEHFPQYRKWFDGFPVRIQKYDFFRYLAVYHYGGFYLDLDVFLARGLDDLREHGCVFPFEELTLHRYLIDAHGLDWEIGNYAFGACAGHPFLAAVIENCIRAQREPAWPRPMWQPIPSPLRRDFYVLATTGPGLLTRTLAEQPGAAAPMKVLFPSDVCDVSTWHRFGTHGVHQQEGGWRNAKSLWRRKLGSWWESRVRRQRMEAARRRGPTRALPLGQPGARAEAGRPAADAAEVARPRERSHGAWRLVAFFALIVALFWALDAAIGHGLRSADAGEFGVWNRIVQGRVNADVVVTGSSRAMSHYDPRILGEALGRKVYNIGLNGAQTDMQLARLETYLRYNRKPELVIHNLDAFAFQVTHGGPYDPGQYVPYLSSPELYEALARVDPDAWKARFLPLYGYAVEDMRFSWLAGLRDAIGSRRPDAFRDGYRPRQTDWTGEFEDFRSANQDGVEIAIEPEGLRRFERVLQLCAERGIRVVLSYSPEYLPVQQMTRNRPEIIGRFEALAARYGARLLDFSASPISAQQRYFYNSQHLNAEGAAEFSRLLAAQLATER